MDTADDRQLYLQLKRIHDQGVALGGLGVMTNFVQKDEPFCKLVSETHNAYSCRSHRQKPESKNKG